MSDTPHDMVNLSERMVELARKANDAAYEYWQAYQQEVAYDAVVWLQNTETGHTLIFTRSEYSERLLAAVPQMGQQTGCYKWRTHDNYT